ncbi:MAG: hypothetical protein KZQ64_11115 [gamma proteobacterium symbiont of Bathyaustriella thionipta]|nr:hypothetical protein [gamma proteobacterium symbiont of Bathyaustriella thionipta]MCU7950075.1 hypothetical protein [gamma proteobacterium symbiont of Bathyaustriella thionipta]MCU7953925.1 hypothetical protein [gamma proteobacterium symbiont of Bathyaustriella thionipta]MCU7956660.1 hypothetical protein [gamma proteobacterium symbiont of Bathyaustriella thionipta]MCU7967868.1 hypothetical protein [gamma proteobacterium symbiont of Bathyaustriella thionipta]
MNSGLGVVGIVIISLVVYFLAIWWIRKWMINNQVSCFWRSLFLAVFLAPGLMLYGEHAGFPLPSFAWMSAANNAYSCIENSLFCSIKLNLFLSILPFLATWTFVYLMCKVPEKE